MTMLVRVLKSKLTLGRSVYQRGDIFECPPQEALMMAAIGLTQNCPSAINPTRAPPLPPRGMSFVEGKAVSYLPTRARKLTSADKVEQIECA
jgi:hypothetical protein